MSYVTQIEPYVSTVINRNHLDHVSNNDDRTKWEKKKIYIYIKQTPVNNLLLNKKIQFKF